jgi:predicted naringenin-chalcone synthase
MAWALGDRGFNLVLSSYVPKVIGANVAGLIERVLAEGGCSTDDIGTWAVHPGGKSIVDKVESNLGLDPEQVAPSRAVLRDYGNMSSATILFVLAHILAADEVDDRRVCAMSFGPGLTIETALLQPVGVHAPAPAAVSG